MIALDNYIMDWMSGNWLACTIFLTLLKGWAVISKNATDDKIHELLSGLFHRVRGKPPVGVPPHDKRGDSNISG